MKFFKPVTTTTCGNTHKENNIENQDVCASYIRNGISVIAIADGASSAQYSAIGADVVVKATCKYIANNFSKIYSDDNVLNVKKEFIDHLIYKLDKKVKKHKCELDDLASTLAFVCVKENEQCIIGHIGDGCICSKEDYEWTVLSYEEKNGAINETQFVTTPNVYAAMRMSKGNVNDFSSFALMTDGCMSAFVSNGVVETGIDLMNNWIKTHGAIKAQEGILNALNTQIINVSDDDMTLCYLSKIDCSCLFDSVSDEDKLSIFEKHYSHIYNAIAAIEDAKKIVDVLKTTNATVQYISKKSKVKISTTQRLIDILLKNDFVKYEDELLVLNEANE